MSVAYAYRAARGDGHFIDGVVEAESLTGATVALRARGLTALSLEPTTSPRTSVMGETPLLTHLTPLAEPMIREATGLVNGEVTVGNGRMHQR